MSKIQTLRGLINQRLSLAAEEIFELFERTIAEYEEQLCRSKENQDKLLEAVYNLEVRLHRADVQTLLVRTEDVPVEQQERCPSLDQEDPPEPAHIKEEEEEPWSPQEMEQLHGLKEEEEEEESSEFTLTPVPVKNEEEEEAESSQLDEKQTEEMLDCESETDDSSDYLEESAKPQSAFNHVSHMESDSVETAVSVSERATSSGQMNEPQKPKEVQKEDRPFCCPICERGFITRGRLNRHMSCHSSEKPFCCSLCGKTFVQKQYLKQHMISHSKEKPFNCTICGKSFAARQSLNLHSMLHSGEKPYSCSQCGKTFANPSRVKAHSAVHTKEKPYSCLLCDARFARRRGLKRHTAVHTGERPYKCNFCDKSFIRPDVFKKHRCEAKSSESTGGK